jgi:hypothetical protein
MRLAPDPVQRAISRFLSARGTGKSVALKAACTAANHERTSYAEQGLNASRHVNPGDRLTLRIQRG